jgi:hypothetical protein
MPTLRYIDSQGVYWDVPYFILIFQEEVVSQLAHLAHLTRTYQNPENLVLTTSSDTAVQANFTTFDIESVRDILLQNDTANKCYVTWGREVVTANASHTILPAYSNLSLDQVSATFFSIIREAGGENVSIHITGVG